MNKKTNLNELKNEIIYLNLANKLSKDQIILPNLNNLSQSEPTTNLENSIIKNNLKSKAEISKRKTVSKTKINTGIQEKATKRKATISTKKNNIEVKERLNNLLQTGIEIKSELQQSTNDDSVIDNNEIANNQTINSTNEIVNKVINEEIDINNLKINQYLTKQQAAQNKLQEIFGKTSTFNVIANDNPQPKPTINNEETEIKTYTEITHGEELKNKLRELTKTLPTKKIISTTNFDSIGLHNYQEVREQEIVKNYNDELISTPEIISPKIIENNVTYRYRNSYLGVFGAVINILQGILIISGFIFISLLFFDLITISSLNNLINIYLLGFIGIFALVSIASIIFNYKFLTTQKYKINAGVLAILTTNIGIIGGVCLLLSKSKKIDLITNKKID